MKLLKKIEIKNKLVLPYIGGVGGNFYSIILRFVDKWDNEKSQDENYLAGDAQGRLFLYFEDEDKGLSRAHWQGFCFMEPAYDNEEFHEKLVDYLLEQKIVEKPILVSFTGWDRSGKVSGSVVRYLNDQDIYYGND